MTGTYLLKLWERAEKANPLHSQIFTGTLADAERRLSEVWNQHLSAVNGERYRAAVIDPKTRKHLTQIF